MASDPGRWGLTLSGPGAIDVAAAALERALKAAGMTCRRTSPREGRIEIFASQDAPWYKILPRCLPQRTSWLFSQRGGIQEISGDFYAFLWHRSVVSVLGLLVAAGMTVIWTAVITESGWTVGTGPFSYVLITTMGAFIAMTYLLLGGAHHREEVWQTLFLAAERAGGSLEPLGRSVSRRNAFVYTALFAFLSPLAALVIKESLAEPLTWESLSTSLVLAVFGVIVLFLIGTAVSMARSPGLSHRTDAFTTGLATLLTTFFYFSPTLMWLAAGDPGTILTRWKSPELVPDAAQAFLVLSVMASPFIASLAFFLFLGVLRSSYLARILTRLQKPRRQGSYQQAVEGGPHLHRLRLVLGVTWTLLAILVFSTLVSLVLCAVQAVDPSFPYPKARLVELSSAVFGRALGGWVSADLLGGLTRFAWVVYALAGVALYALSFVPLLRSRHLELRRLRTAAESAGPDRELQAREALARLAGLAQLDGVKLVVEPKKEPGGAAECFFNLRGPHRFVLVTQGALIDFNGAELDAVLAHELVHLREGHCRKKNLFRWLGRLTFVGDGFVLALQDSFGYEKEADRLLLEERWATPEALAGSLEKMENAAFGYQGSGMLGFGQAIAEEGSPAEATPENELREDERKLRAGEELDISNLRRWRLSWHFFRQQYFTAQGLHYWHPTFKERLEAVRSWSRGAAVRVGGTDGALV